MRELEIEFQDRVLKGRAEKIGTRIWVHLNGRTFSYEPERRSRGGADESGAGQDRIAAPMPGKVVKVLAASGQKVQKSEILVVMEAMKMEYSLRAARDGVIAEVACQEGDQVQLNQVLIRLKEEQK